MRRRSLLIALLTLVLLGGGASVAQASICEDLPAIGVGPFNLKTPCEEAGTIGEALGEAVTNPGKAAEKVVTAPLKVAGDAAMEGVTKWVAGGAGWLVEQAGKLINQTTTPHLESSWFSGEYATMASLAGLLALPLLLLAVLQGVIRHDGALLLRAAFFYLPLAALLTLMAIAVVQLFLALTDQMCSQVVGSVSGEASSFFAGVANALEKLAGSSAAGGVVPLFAVFLGGLIAAVGAFFVWIELVIRDAGIYVAVFFLPLTFIAMIWPVTASWCRRLVELLFAIIFAKFVIVAIMALAAAGLTHSGSSEAYSGLLAGVALLVLAAFSPLALLRMLPMVASAAHTSWRSGAGSQTLGSVAGPAAVMRRVADSHWSGSGGGGGSGIAAMPAFAAAGAGGALAGGAASRNGSGASSSGIGGAAGRAAPTAGNGIGRDDNGGSAATNGSSAAADNGIGDGGAGGTTNGRGTSSNGAAGTGSSPATPRPGEPGAPSPADSAQPAPGAPPPPASGSTAAPRSAHAGEPPLEQPPSPPWPESDWSQSNDPGTGGSDGE